MRTRRPFPFLSLFACAPFGRALTFAAPALALGLSAGQARAETPKKETYALGWARLSGAEACIGSRDLAAGVEKALKRRVFVSAARADRNVEGHVAPRFSGGWAATIRISDAQGRVLGSRELVSDGPNCRELDETVTLSVALMIDSNLSAPPADPLETETAPAAPNAPADAKPAQPDKDDPWGGVAAAPAPARPPATKARGPGEDGFELAAIAGYSIGDQALSDDDTTSSGLNAGLGARAGYQFPGGLWLGFGFMYFAGGTFTRNIDIAENPFFERAGISSRDTEGFVVGRFRAYAPSFEAGYAFSLGPIEGRPYLGFGFVVYDFTVESAYGRSNARTGVEERWDVDTARVSIPPNDLKVSIWPGFSLAWPAGPFFVGADARMMYIIGAGPNFIPSLTAGVRF